jgi:putative DNA primase/helicase
MTFPSDLRTIARALGGEISGNQVVCPGPGHSFKDRSLSVRLDANARDGFIANSFAGDDWRVCRDHVRQRLGIVRKFNGSSRPAPASHPPRSVAEENDIKRVATTVARIVAGIRPIAGSPGEMFLREKRRIDTAPIGDVLERTDAIGWHPAVYFHSPGHELHGQRLGCIVGIMTDVRSAAPTGAISRTYIGPDGKKVGKAKTLGTPIGIVRLSRDDDVCQGLILTEGLETALAAMSIGLRPMWSTGSTGHMRTFPPLAGIECITIIADHDKNGAGENAAAEGGRRWLAAEKEVRIIVRNQRGDLNDALRDAL